MTTQGVMVIGTDTEVGKTAVAAGVLYLLRERGVRAAYFKPVASGMTRWGGRDVSVDGAFVKKVSGFSEPESLVTPFAFKNAVAPSLAARMEGRRIDPDRILACLQNLQGRYDFILAEAAGGLAVPLRDDGLMQYDLIRDLGFPCLLVARTTLGTINHTLLTLHLARDLHIPVTGVILNGFGGTEVEQDNLATLRRLVDPVEIVVVPAVRGVSTEDLQEGDLREVFRSLSEQEGLFRLLGVPGLP
ncbi:MAG: ATP-dependent dethiobiotin synthetase BioD 1 [Synergistetes bacterium ADurb.Bin520]|nr:MAG: ATP-dependent dethiobiotin synthetase BioD 1 [Synergistetes bacterium ADurb.Bin520]